MGFNFIVGTIFNFRSDMFYEELIFFNFSKLHVKMFQILVHTNNQSTGETVPEVRNCDFTSIQILFILLKIL